MLSKKTLMITIISALCLVSLAGAEEPRFEYSEEEAKLYRMPIKQITPKDGIWTGHVIAYGHYIKPPYKIEVRDTCVFINNVQVYPALKTPGMIEKEKKDREREEARKREMTEYIKAHQEEYNEMSRIDSLAKALYKREKEKHGREKAINAVAEFYKKSACVDSVRVITDREILVCYSPGTIQYELLRINSFPRPTHRFIELEPYPPLSSPPDIYKTQEERDEAMRKMGFPTTKQDWAELWARQFKEILLSGMVQTFYPYPSGAGAGLTESELFEIYEIISDIKKNQCKKYEAMKSLYRGIFMHRTIMVFLANYDPNEWKHIKRRQK